MPSFLKKSWPSVVMVVLLIANKAMCQSVIGNNKMSIEITPRQIKVNQPFALIFNISGPDLPGVAPNSKDIRKPAFENLLTMQQVKTNVEQTSINQQTNIVHHYVYVLVPQTAGKATVYPFSINLGNNLVFVSDTISLLVSNERVTREDSIEAYKVACSQPVTHDEIFENATFAAPDTTKKQDGAYFNHPDSIYKATVGKTFSIVYSLSFVNSSGPNLSAMDASPKGLELPDGLDYLGTGQASTMIWRSGYSESTKDYIITVKAKRSGVYKIPPVTIHCGDAVYISKEVTVIVAERNVY